MIKFYYNLINFSNFDYSFIIANLKFHRLITLIFKRFRQYFDIKLARVYMPFDQSKQPKSTHINRNKSFGNIYKIYESNQYLSPFKTTIRKPQYFNFIRKKSLYTNKNTYWHKSNLIKLILNIKNILKSLKRNLKIHGNYTTQAIKKISIDYPIHLQSINLIKPLQSSTHYYKKQTIPSIGNILSNLFKSQSSSLSFSTLLFKPPNIFNSRSSPVLSTVSSHKFSHQSYKFPSSKSDYITSIILHNNLFSSTSYDISTILTRIRESYSLSKKLQSLFPANLIQSLKLIHSLKSIIPATEKFGSLLLPLIGHMISINFLKEAKVNHIMKKIPNNIFSIFNISKFNIGTNRTTFQILNNFRKNDLITKFSDLDTKSYSYFIPNINKFTFRPSNYKIRQKAITNYLKNEGPYSQIELKSNTSLLPDHHINHLSKSQIGISLLEEQDLNNNEEKIEKLGKIYHDEFKFDESLDINLRDEVEYTLINELKKFLGEDIKSELFPKTNDFTSFSHLSLFDWSEKIKIIKKTLEEILASELRKYGI